MREGLIDPANTASDVWADTAYRSAANEAFLERTGKTSRIHHKKPKGKPMLKTVAKGNESKARSGVEHVFAVQKDCMGCSSSRFGIARAQAAITLANMAHNMKRWCWLNGRNVPA